MLFLVQLEYLSANVMKCQIFYFSTKIKIHLPNHLSRCTLLQVQFFFCIVKILVTEYIRESMNRTFLLKTLKLSNFECNVSTILRFSINSINVILYSSMKSQNYSSYKQY